MSTLLGELRDKGKSLLRTYAKQPGVIGTAIIGSVGRGDVWEGSDIDLLVALGEDRSRYWGEGRVEGQTYYVTRGYLNSLLEADFFAESMLPDMMWGCQVHSDTDQILHNAKAHVERNRFKTDVVRKKIEIQLRQQRDALRLAQSALDEGDCQSAMFFLWPGFLCATLFLHFGELIRSATRQLYLVERRCRREGLIRLYEGIRPDMDVDAGMLRETVKLCDDLWDEVNRLVLSLPPDQVARLPAALQRAATLEVRPREGRCPPPNCLRSCFKHHIAKGYFQDLHGHIVFNTASDLVNLLEDFRIALGLDVERERAFVGPTSPFVALRKNPLVTNDLYGTFVRMTGLNRVGQGDVASRIQNIKDALREVEQKLIAGQS